MNRILVLTYTEDPHADSVCNYLHSTGHYCFRVDTDRLIEDYSITFDSDRGLFVISDRRSDHPITDDWCIWNRRILDPSAPADMPADLLEIVKTETRRTWEGLLYSFNGRIVNHPRAQLCANNKIHQLLFAKRHRSNTKVPHTLITNDPQRLREFWHSKDKTCHKLQRQCVVEKDGAPYTVYTNVVNAGALDNAELIRRNPCIFQEYVEKEYELRITALVERCIGIAIHSQESDCSRIDWRRYDFENVEYENVNLPSEVENFCGDILRNYGLSFAQIDMILTPSGDYIFLEINPNGQWLWLEKQSGYDLTKPIAENLIR